MELPPIGRNKRQCSKMSAARPVASTSVDSLMEAPSLVEEVCIYSTMMRSVCSARGRLDDVPRLACRARRCVLWDPRFVRTNTMNAKAATEMAAPAMVLISASGRASGDDGSEGGPRTET